MQNICIDKNSLPIIFMLIKNRGQKVAVSKNKTKLNRILLIIVIATIAFCNNIMAKAEENLYYIGGFPLGFDLSADGALIVGLSEVICADDIYLPAKDAGLKSGDYILSLNGKKIVFSKDIDEVLSSYESGFVIAEILSDGKKSIKNIYPKKDLSGKYKLGVLIRDYISGLGTVTLINENGKFCSLGHPILDEEGKMLGVGGGYVYNCVINGIVKGERGKAGELKGTILRNSLLGDVTQNSSVGILGHFKQSEQLYQMKKYMTGTAEPGKAEIFTTLSGSSPKRYEIEIIKVDSKEKNNKNMVIRVTDDKLIRCSGGIVQGMSGSPILQNNKIVGAVTHVFLNDSTRGYAICIDKMTDILNN